MGLVDEEHETETKRKMRIAYAFALIAMATFMMAAGVTVLAAAIR